MTEFAHRPVTRPGVSLERGLDSRSPLRWRHVAPAVVLVDAGAIVALSWATGATYNSLVFNAPYGVSAPHALFGVFVALSFLLISVPRGYYGYSNLVSKRTLDSLLFSWLGAYLLALAGVFLLKAGTELSRAAVAIFFVLGCTAVVLLRLATRAAVAWAIRHGYLASRRVMLVGEDPEIDALLRSRHPGDMDWAVLGRLPIGSNGEQLGHVVANARRLRPDGILLIMPWSRTEDVVRCVEALSTVPAAIHLALPHELSRFRQLPTSWEEGLPHPLVVRAPLSVGEQLSKRVFDILVASVALMVLWPVMAAIALAIRLETPGPALFCQPRNGFNNDTFRIYKFRSMHYGPESHVFRQAVEGDARVTRIGGWLRRWNLDELPQLLNVLRGEMSVVGPRPHAVAHDEDFSRRIALYARRHNIKPGITGWAQVNGFRGPTDTDLKMQARVEHDLYYLDNWSLWFDVKIVLMTIAGRKAYENAF